MTVEHIELLVEEPSMEAALRLLLPKIIGAQSFETYSHQGKSELLARLPQRLRGYASWLPDQRRDLGGLRTSFAESRYFRGGLRKIEAARMIAAHMNPERNRSPSFIALRDVLLEMIGV